ncbi:hypothetical protein [Pseudomonas sp.]|uniref:hypothetical protein n=1 Tax=Pseudomonas sp. TaxID=306 RepID=UPI00299F37CE|nr:hypothetical protein [Pseudomonas sp.]MDX1368519.1 hypothetical protein [Pseudomonas sp.]
MFNPIDPPAQPGLNLTVGGRAYLTVDRAGWSSIRPQLTVLSRAAASRRTAGEHHKLETHRLAHTLKAQRYL